jgi:MFS family permease
LNENNETVRVTHAASARQRQERDPITSAAPNHHVPGTWNRVALLLRERNYVIFLIGRIASNSGSWAQRIAQDWLVLELSGNSGTALGLVVLLQSAPIIVFGMWGGKLADRYAKTKIMILCNAGMAILTAALGVLSVSGSLALWHIYIFAALLGAATAFDQPAASAFLIRLTGIELLPVAVVINVSTYEITALLGPLAAGLLMSVFDLGVMFLVNSLSFAVMLTCIALVRTQSLHNSEVSVTAAVLRKRRGELGISYARQNVIVLLSISLVAIVSTFGQSFQVILPLLVREGFGMAATAYATLAGALAAGALVGAAVAIRIDVARVRVLVCSGLSSGFLLVLVAASPSFPVLLAALVPVGAARSIFASASNSLVQLYCDPDMRGRVMALYMQVLLISTSLGSLAYGVSAELLGAQLIIAVGGVIVLFGCPMVSWLIIGGGRT